MTNKALNNELDDCRITALLAMPIIQHLSPIKELLTNFETIHLKQGEVILSQGHEGFYYYLIKHGHCLCTRQSKTGAKKVILRTLGAGDTFGEDALIMDAPRDLTVTADTDMTLLRLAKEYFINLIKEPALTFISPVEMRQAKVKGAVLLDLRKPEEYRTQHIEGSINLPFFTLRMQLKKLNHKKSFIFICKDGKFSQAAAFLLVIHGFKVALLKDGIRSVNLSSLEVI